MQGSCIIDRKGDILAWNDGDQELTMAAVKLEDGYLDRAGGDVRQITHLLRRLHLCGLCSDESCLGPPG